MQVAAKIARAAGSTRPIPTEYLTREEREYRRWQEENARKHMAAFRIHRFWRDVSYDPQYAHARMRLLREAEESGDEEGGGDGGASKGDNGDSGDRGGGQKPAPATATATRAERNAI
eukprot:g4049.t1